MNQNGNGSGNGKRLATLLKSWWPILLVLAAIVTTYNQVHANTAEIEKWSAALIRIERMQCKLCFHLLGIGSGKCGRACEAE